MNWVKIDIKIYVLIEWKWTEKKSCKVWSLQPVISLQLSKYGHRAWTWDDVRGQWYYHTYTPSQPDLNLRNPAVQKELEVKNAVKFFYIKLSSL